MLSQPVGNHRCSKQLPKYTNVVRCLQASCSLSSLALAMPPHMTIHVHFVALLCLVSMTDRSCNYSVWRWWFNYLGPLHSTEIELPCSSGKRQLCLCIIIKDSACPAELPRWFIGRASAWYTEHRRFESCLRQLFFFS